MLVRMTEAFLSYLMLSIIETSVILRMVNDHPYGAGVSLTYVRSSINALSGTSETAVPYHAHYSA